jgi:hypothetical protein
MTARAIMGWERASPVALMALPASEKSGTGVPRSKA